MVALCNDVSTPLSVALISDHVIMLSLKSCQKLVRLGSRLATAAYTAALLPVFAHPQHGLTTRSAECPGRKQCFCLFRTMLSTVRHYIFPLHLKKSLHRCKTPPRPRQKQF